MAGTSLQDSTGYSDGTLTIKGGSIPDPEMVKLVSADDSKAIADVAEDTLEEMSCAYDINYAADTGCHSTYYDHPISKKLQAKLKSLGYDVYQVKSAADPTKHWIIQGF